MLSIRLKALVIPTTQNKVNPQFKITITGSSNERFAVSRNLMVVPEYANIVAARNCPKNFLGADKPYISSNIPKKKIMPPPANKARREGSLLKSEKKIRIDKAIKSTNPPAKGVGLSCFLCVALPGISIAPNLLAKVIAKGPIKKESANARKMKIKIFIIISWMKIMVPPHVWSHVEHTQNFSGDGSAREFRLVTL
jgi:hypothetical protein